MVTDMSASLSREQVGQIVRRTPLGRLATVLDVVSLVDFLLSDAAACITGQTIVIDGGISV
jgi:3-oxoacyl-[acyl-carrier protein] reductase